MTYFNVTNYIKSKIDADKNLRLINVRQHLAKDGLVFNVADGNDPTLGVALVIKDSDDKESVDVKFKNVMDYLFGVKK
jgi:hypothetical protein